MPKKFDILEVSDDILIDLKWICIIEHEEVWASELMEEYIRRLYKKIKNELEWLQNETKTPPMISMFKERRTGTFAPVDCLLFKLWIRPEDHIIYVLKFE